MRIIGLHFNESGRRKFKAHLTKNISNREQLHLQGYKVIYNDFTNLEYEIFSINLLEQIERLVYQSFTATGKSLDNSDYEKEWEILTPKKELELSFNNQQVELLIQIAIKEKKKVKISYKNKEGFESQRILSNLNIINKFGPSGFEYEVLQANCSLKGIERNFKIERIKEIELLD